MSIGLFLLAVVASGHSFGQTAVVKGTVVDQNGKSVGGATVSVGIAIPAKPPTSPPTVLPGSVTSASKWVGYALTAPDGTFMISNLDPATYVLCAEAHASAILSNCAWPGAPTPPTVTLAAGQTSGGTVIKCVKGSTLQVRINDPLGILTALITPSVPSKVLSGVIGPHGQFYPSRVVSSDALGQNHAVNIPFDVDLKYTISSVQVKLTDSSGAGVLPTGAAVGFRHISGASTQPSFSFSVSKP